MNITKIQIPKIIQSGGFILDPLMEATFKVALMIGKEIAAMLPKNQQTIFWIRN